MTGNESKRNCKRIGPEWEWTRMPETIEYVDIEHEAWNAMPLDEGGFDEDLDDEYEEACRLAAEERDIAGAGVPTCAAVPD